MPRNTPPTSHRDLSTLSLEAALQLDRLERNQEADRHVLTEFLNRMWSLDAETRGTRPLHLHENPLDVEIFNWALHRSEMEPKDVSELEAKVNELLTTLKDVAEGGKRDRLGLLKTFCLALHQALLNEAAPFRSDDDIVLSRE